MDPFSKRMWIHFPSVKWTGVHLPRSTFHREKWTRVHFQRVKWTPVHFSRWGSIFHSGMVHLQSHIATTFNNYFVSMYKKLAILLYHKISNMIRTMPLIYHEFQDFHRTYAV